MDESTFRIHEIELVIQTSPCFSDRSCVAQHTHCTLDLGKISPWYNRGGLVVDADLETGGTPVHKLKTNDAFMPRLQNKLGEGEEVN